MSLDSLGSLAQTMSDRYLRENFRRIVTGTNMSVTAIMDGEHRVFLLQPLSLSFIICDCPLLL